MILRLRKLETTLRQLLETCFTSTRKMLTKEEKSGSKMGQAVLLDITIL